MSDLTIVHLYPSELGINGDAGNVTALQKRAHWRGIPATVHNLGVGDDLPTTADIIHIGSGPLSSQRAVHADVLRLAPALVDAAATGVPILAVAAGWQLLSRGFRTSDGEDIQGAGVFPSRTVLRTARTVGEVVIRSAGTVLAGFENHSGTTTLEDGAEPLGVVVSGGGNDPSAARDARTEGIRIGSSIGTHLHGPFLPMNPHIADELLRAGLTHSGSGADHWAEAAQADAADEAAAKSRHALASRLGVRI